MSPGFASQVIFLGPSKSYPSGHLILHVDPYEVSHLPTTEDPFDGSRRAGHCKTIKKKTRGKRKKGVTN